MVELLKVDSRILNTICNFEFYFQKFENNLCDNYFVNHNFYLITMNQ